ncbi:contactin-2-like [Gigantopelta aegis]|uniref:contactin-2-like n=1 Tax=Gigantopelta aegis TaxID=1735272 RepID=UPI001B888A88|nr:contactin-2-like [Gigantopelta aegis]
MKKGTSNWPRWFNGYAIGLEAGLVLSSRMVKYIGDDVAVSCLPCQFNKESGYEIAVSRLENETATNSVVLLIVKASSSTLDIPVRYKDRITFNGSLENLNIRFLLKNVSGNDAGIYKCSQGSSISCNTSLIVVDTPGKPNVTSLGPAVVHHNVTLACSARSRSAPEGHGLKMSYHWKMDGELIQDGRYFVRGGTVSFEVSRKLDGNQFSCSAEEEKLVSEESDPFAISVEYKPRKIRFEPDSNVRVVAVGKVLDVLCTADCRPRCRLSWVNRQTKREVAGVNDTMFKLESVTRSDHGNYTCTVQNQHGKRSRNLFVDVHSEPNTRTVRVTRITQHEYSSQYEIGRAKCSDYGTYYCQSDNGIGNPVNGLTWQLTVYCAPRLSSRSSFAHTFGKQNGKPLTVNLEIELYPLHDNYLLYQVIHGERRESANVVVTPINSDTVYLHTYELMFLVDVRLGVESYSFMVENSEGTTFIDFNVTLIGPPLTPTEFLVEPGTDFITLYWVPGYYGGFPQSFVVAYKTEDESEWKTKNLELDPIDGEGRNMTAVVRGFLSATDYYLQLYAINVKGRSGNTEVIRVMTLPAPASEASAGMVAGIIIAVIIIIIIIVIIIIVLFIRRKQQKKESDVESTVEYQKPFLEEPQVNADGSTVDEKKASVEELYAEVKKNPKMTDEETPHDNGEKPPKDEKEEKMEENEKAPLIPDKKYDSEEVSPSNNNDIPSKKEDVVYSDLDFSALPSETTETPVICGKENATNYDTVDFTKKALPEDPEQEDDSAYENMVMKK